MAAYPPIRLRYFDARARAQFLRAYLNARDIAFEDERVPLDEGFASWRAIRPDRSRSGPLQRLPVLHFGDELIPETLVIANFLHVRTGDEAALGAQRGRQHEVLISSASGDLLLPVAMLIWADLMYPGVDLAQAARGVCGRVLRTLDALEQAVAEWGWVESMSERPVTLADCLLWEALDQSRTLFGPSLDLATRPNLARLYAEHPARARFESLLAAHPAQITGRPGEPAAIAAVQAALHTDA